ncbi:dephospho-CoA kinase [Pontibacter beigongshangensis]|uniref:dephospho-CoA kinase n=1 Tax=Pontibacter beigongshangensis TaxID=2574733 RepID=UPI00164F538F|nr:dephospho-CoA kinase [Pontibacter beigongshangensis]
MLKIGITGGIGAGKSIVCRVFQLLGVPVYDSDARAKQVMQQNAALKDDLINTFGPDAYDTAGTLNRSYIASQVFNNPERLARLNALVHPRVATDFEQWAAAQAPAPYVLKEAALMYESQAWRQMDEIITVFSPMEVRIRRLLHRDAHRTEADVRAIISRQLQEEEKIARADHIIYNDDQQLIIPQVIALHQQFLSRN